MKQTVELRRSPGNKLHAPTCTKATNYSDITIVADYAAFDAIPFETRAYCCLGGHPSTTYQHLRYNQASAEEQAYWDADAILHNDRPMQVDWNSNEHGWLGHAKMLAQFFTKTTEEGRTLLRPRIAQALAYFTDIGVLRDAIEIAAG